MSAYFLGNKLVDTSACECAKTLMTTSTRARVQSLYPEHAWRGLSWFASSLHVSEQDQGEGHCQNRVLKESRYHDTAGLDHGG